MDLKPNSKIDTNFSLASMTDIIFQLLIFFMLTSSFVTPAALPVNLPSSVESPTISPKVNVTITRDLLYFINETPTSPENIEEEMRDALTRAEEPIVVLNIDKDVAVQYMVRIASIANRLGAKVSIATKIDSSE